MQSIQLSRNTKGVRKAICTLILLVFATSLYGQIQTQRIENKLKIVFEEFNRVDNSKYHAKAGVDVASLIKTGLMEVQYLEFVTGNPKKQHITSDKQRYALTEDAYDISVYGSYAFYRDTFMIDVNLFGAQDHSVININPITGSLDQLYDKLKGLKEDIINAIQKKWRNPASATKKIAVLCLVKNKKTLRQINIDYVKQVTIQTTKGVEEKPGYNIIPWDRAARYYLSELSPKEISTNLKTDALLIANLDVKRETILIYPVFYILETDRLIELGEIRNTYFSDVELNEELIYRANNFLSNILKGDGSWNLELYTQEASSYEDYYQLGNYYAEQSLPSVSNYYYFKAQGFNDDSSDLYDNVASNLKSLGRKEEAKQEYKKSIELNTSKTDTYYNLWNLYINEANYTKALEIARQAYKNVEENIQNLSMMGISLYYVNDYVNAVNFLKKGINISPDNSKLHGYLGLSNLSLHKNREALDHFRTSLELDKENPDYKYYMSQTMVALGSNLIKEKKYDEALKYLLDSNQYEDLDYVAGYILKCYLMTGQLEKAIATFDEYLLKGYYSDKKDNYQFALDIRTAFLTEGPGYLHPEYGQAIQKYIDKHLKFVPNDSYALWVLGNTYTYLGNMEKSIGYLEKAYTIDKTNSIIFLDLAESLLLNKQYEKSDEICSEVLAKNTIPIEDIILLKLIHIGNIGALHNQLEEKDTRFIYQQIKKGKTIKNWSFTAFKKWIENTLTGKMKAALWELVEAVERSTT